MALPVVLLSGDRGVGKSTLCLRLADAIRRDYGAGSVAGVVTMASGSLRTAILFPTEERVPLALDTGVREGDPARRTAAFTGPTVGPFRFSRECIDRVNALFRAEPTAPGAERRLWFLDEVGPLEIRMRKAFFPAFQAVKRMAADGDVEGTAPPGAAGSVPAAVVVVRPELRDEVRDAFAPAACEVYHLTADTRERVFQVLRERLAGWLAAGV
ncbi:MAG: hypothetical protein ACOCYG_01860 [Spirochaetota bacterium]